MTKTLADLLQEDGAQEGDVYEACDETWTLTHASNLWNEIQGCTLDRLAIALVPADGWRRVRPKKPLRVEFETKVTDRYVIGSDDELSFQDYIPCPYRMISPFVGKRVKVTVEEMLK
jgi:hypothetical protein